METENFNKLSRGNQKKVPFMESPKKKKGCFIFIGIIIFFIILSKILPSSSKTAEVAVVAVVKMNIDSLINVIKKDTVYGVKDVFYNKKDSSLNIAFPYKKGDAYSTIYFNKVYHIDSFPCFDGVYLYAYKKGKFLKNGDYKTYLTFDSKRVGRLMNIFKEKYCSEWSNTCIPLRDYLKQNLNDPDSYESDKLWVDWNKDSSFVVVNSFRAKNAFGTMMLNKCRAIVDINGNVSDFSIDN